jgi:hypothetical protein
MNEDGLLSSRLHQLLLIGVWAMPIHGALLTISTLTHQPDYDADFAAYAQYVTTAPFLVSHLVASILGAAFGIVGLTSAALLAAEASGRPGRSLLAAVLGVTGNVLNVAIFGVAAFAQPAIGRAYQAGDAGAAVGINADVYGAALFGTAAAALLFWTAGAVMLGLTVRRSGRAVRAAGLAYGVTVPLFFVVGLPGGMAQPIVGLLYTLAAVVIARRLPQVSGRTPDRVAVA